MRGFLTCGCFARDMQKAGAPAQWAEAHPTPAKRRSCAAVCGIGARRLLSGITLGLRQMA